MVHLVRLRWNRIVMWANVVVSHFVVGHGCAREWSILHSHIQCTGNAVVSSAIRWPRAMYCYCNFCTPYFEVR